MFFFSCVWNVFWGGGGQIFEHAGEKVTEAWEMCIMKIFKHLAEYGDDWIEDDDTVTAYSMRGREQDGVQNSGRKTSRKENTWKT
jgi:hypothetical protein